MLSVRDVEAAAERIRDAIYQSPCVKSLTLSEMTGNQVFLKLENLQMTGSFKERGALNRLLTLPKLDAARGVITASAGNHAQGLAYHATRLGIASQIVMPLQTPLVKVSRTQGYGGEVVLHGVNYDEAYQEACRRAEASGATFVHAFDDSIFSSKNEPEGDGEMTGTL